MIIYNPHENTPKNTIGIEQTIDNSLTPLLVNGMFFFLNFIDIFSLTQYKSQLPFLIIMTNLVCNYINQFVRNNNNFSNCDIF